MPVRAPVPSHCNVWAGEPRLAPNQSGRRLNGTAPIYPVLTGPATGPQYVDWKEGAAGGTYRWGYLNAWSVVP